MPHARVLQRVWPPDYIIVFRYQKDIQGIIVHEQTVVLSPPPVLNSTSGRTHRCVTVQPRSCCSCHHTCMVPALCGGEHVCHSQGLAIKSLHFVFFCIVSIALEYYCTLKGLIFLATLQNPHAQSPLFINRLYVLLCPGSNLPCKHTVLLLHCYDKKLATRVQPNNCTNSNSPAVFI